MEKEQTLRIEGGTLKRCADPEGPVVVPEGVTELGRAAFYGCGALTRVRLPSGVRRVGGSAFASCPALTAVDLPDGLEELGSWAFSGCSALRRIRLPAGIRDLGERTFLRCAALEEAVLPPELERIGPEAFRGCASLRRIDLPETVRRIAAGAFEGCSSLTEAAIPAGVVRLERNTFKNCTGLKRVILPDTLERVEPEAFAGCRGLEEIVFPGRVAFIAPSALTGCASLRRVVSLSAGAGALFSPENVPLVAPALSPAGSDREMELLMGYAEAAWEGAPAYPPERVREYRNDLRLRGRALALPALNGCPGLLEQLLETEAIPPGEVDGLISLCEDVERRTALLAYKGRLTGSGVPESREEEETNRILSLGPMAPEEAERFWAYRVENGEAVLLSWRGGEREIFVPDQIGPWPVAALGERALSPLAEGLLPGQRADRAEIRAVYLPAGLRRIGSEAFRNCAALEELLLPDSPESVGSGAFLGTRWWAGRPEGGVYVGTLFYRVRGDLPDGFVRIREGTVRIGPMGFFGCGSLRRIVFPAGLWEIGEYAFFNCGGLGETVVPESVSAIGERAFQGCRSMGRITLPAGLERLGPHVFFDCPGLTVRAPAGSTAAGYAREAGFPLEEDPN